jgi:hypothetical protein
MGQVCLRLGVPRRHLRDISAVELLPLESVPGLLTEWGFGDLVAREWVNRCYDANDNQSIDDATRETQLKRIARKAGHTFVFVDKVKRKARK